MEEDVRQVSSRLTVAMATEFFSRMGAMSCWEAQKQSLSVPHQASGQAKWQALKYTISY